MANNKVPINISEQSGYRLLDGSDINTIIAAVNSNGTFYANSSVINYYAYNPFAAGSASDLTTSLQNFFLQCQLVALSLKSNSNDNLAMRSTVTAYLPRGRYTISSPLIVPEYVNIKADGVFIRTGSSGTVTNFYTGDTTSKALANLFEPAIIVVPRANAETINLIQNSNGVDRGSGIFFGKNWTITSAILYNAGKFYQAGDVLSLANPSVTPYLPCQITVNTVDFMGRIQTFTVTNGGAYSLPPVLQQQQWTATNGFNVFDYNGYFIVSGGHGTGASFTVTWANDFDASTGHSYYGGQGGLIYDSIIGHINPIQSARTSDAFYGPTFNVQMYGLNAVFDELECQNAFNGLRLVNMSDLRFNRFNPVDCETALLLTNSSSIECPNVVIDTPTGSAPAVQMDGCTGIRMSGRCFFRNLSNLGSYSAGTIALGLFSTGSQLNTDIQLNFTMIDAGQSGDSSHISSIGCPALYLDYTQNFDINLNISNHEPGFSGLFSVINSFCSFGSNTIQAGRLRGSIDGVYGSIFQGTIPSSVDIDIWDAEVSITNGTETITVGGTPHAGDVVSLTFTNAWLAHTYSWPRTVSYTVQVGDSTTNIAIGLAAAINADAILSITGTIATQATNVVTFNQMGVDANNTVITYSISGSATETITFGNGGNVSGSISGGRVRAGGIYEIVGSTNPTNGVAGTGWNKALPGSKYTNNNNGNVFYNTGSANSPSWL